MPAARARTTIATYLMQNVMCAICSWPNEPCASNSCRKNSSRLRPMTISGVTIGRRSRVSAPARPGTAAVPAPRPSSEPRITRHEDRDEGDLERDRQGVEQLVVGEQASGTSRA